MDECVAYSEYMIVIDLRGFALSYVYCCVWHLLRCVLIPLVTFVPLDATHALKTINPTCLTTRSSVVNKKEKDISPYMYPSI